LNPTLLAVLKVVAIVTGQVLGVIASHDRAIKLPHDGTHLHRTARLLVAMVFYAATGLYLLVGASPPGPPAGPPGIVARVLRPTGRPPGTSFGDTATDESAVTS